MLSVGSYEYSQSELIGHGAFALVFKGCARKTGEAVAIKQISLKSVPGKLSNVRQKEISILKELKHPNIVQLFHYQETKSDVFLVMEYCNGGDLGDYLQAKKTLSEDSIHHLCLHIAGALQVLHSVQVIHRDIKPQNLLLHSALAASKTFREYTIKLADFGFARHLSGADLAATLCGSPLYMAPEVLIGQRYDGKADLWSVGTILYQCWVGVAPFTAANPHALRRKYEKGQLTPRIPEGTSPVLADLLTKLLKKNPADRMSHEEVFVHNFLTSKQEAAAAVTTHSLPAKSSPVPIRNRVTSLQPQRRSVDVESSSPSSGPPSLHPIGSYPEPYLSGSPSTDVVDHGFIIVDYPGSGSSPGKPSSTSPASLPLTAPLSIPFYSKQQATSPSSNYQQTRRKSQESSSSGVPFGQLVWPGSSPISSSPSSFGRQSSLQPLTSYGSGAKLSSLAEERGEDLITPSQLLNSDDDNFTARFSMHSSSIEDLANTESEGFGSLDQDSDQLAAVGVKDSTASDSLQLARWVLQMARSRRGPVRFLSVSSSSQAQRCQEQLLLYAEAVRLLQRQPEVPGCRELLQTCLNEAGVAQSQLQQHDLRNGVCAEQLLLAEALSQVKSAVLEEQEEDCVKSAVKAVQLLKYLLSLAQSQSDVLTLQQYISFVDGTVARKETAVE